MCKHITQWAVFIGSISLFLAAILLLAGFLFFPVLATPQQQTTTTTTTSPDTTAPTLIVDNGITIFTPSPQTYLYYNVTAQDNVDGTATLDVSNMLTQDNVGGSITISCNPASRGTIFPAGNYTVQCSATDAAGNPATASFNAEIISSAAQAPPAGTDTIAPSLSVPGTRVIPTISPTGEELVLYDVSATDNVDGTATLSNENILIQDMVGGSITISCNPPSNTNFPLGNHTVQCSATDAAGNPATASFIVAVTSPGTTPPSGTSGGGITASLTVNPPIYEGPCPPPSRPTILQWIATITDNVGNRDVTFRLIFSDGGSLAEEVIHFDQPGSQSVSINVTPSLEGWGAIEILQPVQLQSNRAEFQITCTPSTGGAAPQTLRAENDTTTTATITTDEDDDEEEDTTTDGVGGTGGDDATDGDGGGTNTGGTTDNAEPE